MPDHIYITSRKNPSRLALLSFTGKSKSAGHGNTRRKIEIGWAWEYEGLMKISGVLEAPKHFDKKKKNSREVNKL